MAVTTTPLGYQKPDGDEPIRNGDNIMSANAQLSDDLISADRAALDTHAARLANLDNAAGFTGDPLALNDAAVAEAVKNGTASHAELDARLAIQNPPIVASIIANDPTVANSAATMAQNTAGLVPVWKATTSYTAGQRVIAPNGDIVSAKTNFTTTATFNVADWLPGRDTGWRAIDVTVVTGSIRDAANPGTLKLRRVDSTVTMRIDGLKLTPGVGVGFIFPNNLPQGFKAWNKVGSTARGVIGDILGGWFEHSIYVTDNDVLWASATNNSLAKSTTRPTQAAQRMQGEMTWTTDDFWPTTLPGTAA